MKKQNVATVTKPFNGAPDGELAVRPFKEGDKISGELALVAVMNGWALFDDGKSETKAKSAAPENKAKDGTFQGSDGGDPGVGSKPKPKATGSRKKSTGKKSK